MWLDRLKPGSQYDTGAMSIVSVTRQTPFSSQVLFVTYKSLTIYGNATSLFRHHPDTHENADTSVMRPGLKLACVHVKASSFS